MNFPAPTEIYTYGHTLSAHDALPSCCIFLNHQKHPEVSLQEFLGDFGTRFAGVSWENTDTSLYFEAHLDANWKVLADAFSATYHIPSIPPAPIAKTFASSLNPLSRPPDAHFLGPPPQSPP